MYQLRAVYGYTELVARHHDIGRQIIVYPQLHPVSIIGVVYMAAVKVVCPPGQVLPVVADAGNLAVGIAHHVAVGIVGTLRVQVGPIYIIHGILVSRPLLCQVSHLGQTVAVVLIGEVVCHPVHSAV